MSKKTNPPRSSIWTNSLLAEFYQCLWATCPFKDNFRLEFARERKRQWDIKETIKKVNNKVSYITSTNPAAAGNSMHENFQAKEHDSITISNNIDALVKAKGKLESLSTEITEQDNALFMTNGLRLRPGMQCKHSANQEFLKNTSSIQSTVEETLELLQKAKQRVERIFPCRAIALKRRSRKQKQNRRKADKRKCQRYAENEKSIKTRILKVDEETLNDEDNIIDHEDLILSAVSSIKAFEVRYLVSMLDSTPTTTHSIKLIKENPSAHSITAVL